MSSENRNRYYIVKYKGELYKAFRYFSGRFSSLYKSNFSKKYNHYLSVFKLKPEKGVEFHVICESLSRKLKGFKQLL